MNLIYALFLVTAPIMPDGTIGQDEWMVIDGNLSFRDCAVASFDRSAAAMALFGDNTVATLVCEPDPAPEVWK